MLYKRVNLYGIATIVDADLNKDPKSIDGQKLA